MSRQLAISSTLSVLLMAAFAVLAPHAARVAQGSDSGGGPFGIEASAGLAR